MAPRQRKRQGAAFTYLYSCILALLVACALGGCKPDVSVGGPGTTAPSAAGPVASVALSGRIINADAGYDLSVVRNLAMVNAQFRLLPPESGVPMVFGLVRNDARKISSPVILRKTAAGWKISELMELPQHEFIRVAAISARHEIWGIFDNADSNAPQLSLIRSVDGGATWQYQVAVKKPHPDADYEGFALAGNGEGRLSMHLDEDSGGVAHGTYHYRTTDGGKTWMGPRIEADDAVAADDVGDLGNITDVIRAIDGAATRSR